VNRWASFLGTERFCTRLMKSTRCCMNICEVHFLRIFITTKRLVFSTIRIKYLPLPKDGWWNSPQIPYHTRFSNGSCDSLFEIMVVALSFWLDIDYISSLPFEWAWSSFESTHLVLFCHQKGFQGSCASYDLTQHCLLHNYQMGAVVIFIMNTKFLPLFYA
jgi:hypothetical protein